MYKKKGFCLYMRNKKIALIGAGSANFSLGLIKDLCNTPGLAGTTVSFMDINEQRLTAVHKFCTRYAAEIGVSLNAEMTTDREESLQDADIVISTALAAPYSRMLKGWEIAHTYGFKLPGSLHILYDEAFWLNFYQFRLYDQVTEDILRICPRAWHLLVANPVITLVTHLKRKYPDAKLAGICHGYGWVYNLSCILGLDYGKVTFRAPGVNHFIWLNSFQYNGKDAFPVLDRWIEEKSERYWTEHPEAWKESLSRKSVDIYKAYGALPLGDTAHWTGSNWPWWYHTSEETNARWQEGDPMAGWNSYLSVATSTMETMIRAADDDSVRISQKFAGKTTEPIVPMVESLLCNVPREMVVNVLNQDEFVAGLPRDFGVEVPAVVDGSGIRPLRTNPLPKPVLAHIYRDRIAPVEMEIAAYTRKSRRLLTDLVLMDHWARSREEVEAFIAKIIAMEGHEAMRAWYAV